MYGMTKNRFNGFPVKNQVEMKYDMTKTISINQVLDGLHPVLLVDVREGVQHVLEVLKIILNRIPFKNQASMMYGMTKKYFHKLLDGLPLVLVVVFREGVQHVPEALEIILYGFPVKKQAEMMYDMKKKKIHQLPDDLPIVLVVDFREGVQYVPEVLEIILNRFPVKNQAEMMYDMTKNIGVLVTKKNLGKVVLQLEKCYRRMHKKFQDYS